MTHVRRGSNNAPTGQQLEMSFRGTEAVFKRFSLKSLDTSTAIESSIDRIGSSHANTFLQNAKAASKIKIHSGMPVSDL